MKPSEIYQNIDPGLIQEMFLWIRENERQLYKSAVASLTSARKLRPVFVEKKPIPEQIAWLHKTLKLRTSDAIGEHLFQVYLIKAHKSLLVAFCDGMGIEHDGEGSVEGALPDNLDDGKLSTTIDSLLESNAPGLVALYLHIFNLQTKQGWGNLGERLSQDDRLKLS